MALALFVSGECLTNCEGHRYMYTSTTPHRIVYLPLATPRLPCSFVYDRTTTERVCRKRMGSSMGLSSNATVVIGIHRYRYRRGMSFAFHGAPAVGPACHCLLIPTLVRQRGNQLTTPSSHKAQASCSVPGSHAVPAYVFEDAFGPLFPDRAVPDPILFTQHLYWP